MRRILSLLSDIMRSFDGAGDISTSSSADELSSDFVLLLSSLDILSVNLFLLNRLLRFLMGRMSGNGGGCIDDEDDLKFNGGLTRNDDDDDCGAGSICSVMAGDLSIPSATRLCSSSSSCPMKLRLGEMMGRAIFTT